MSPPSTSQSGDEGDDHYFFKLFSSQVSLKSESIPMVHKDYEKHIIHIESENRDHIKRFNEMKYYIETSDEKL